MKRRRRRNRQRIPAYIYPVAIVTMGVIALVLSIAVPHLSVMTGPKPSRAMFTTPSSDFESYDQPVTSTAKRLTPGEQSTTTGDAGGGIAPEPAQKRQPLSRAAAPSAAEAQPAVKAMSLGASSAHASNLPDAVARQGGGNVPSVSAAGPNAVGVASNTGPYTVSIVSEGPPELGSLASNVQASLKQRGIDAKVSGLDDAGRPDAVLVLGQSASANASETWVCDPGPAASTVLAKDLQGIGGPSGNDAGPKTSFPCEDIHAGRARVPAVLMELPGSLLSKGDSFAPTADSVASGISRYFTDNAATVKSARAASRLIWPAKGPITSYYGPSHPLGIDIGQYSGNIVAATDGTVMFAGGDPCCSYGRYVIVMSAEGIQTLYAHMSSLNVKKGQKVRQGQVLGIEGCTGHCTGPHLHFEVLDQGKRQNPLLYLP